jgi:Flp pilus assembly protein TadG
MKRLTPGWLGRRGGAAVEFAITLPVLTFLLLMTFEYAWYYSQRGFVLNSVRDATRYAILQDVSQMKTVADARLKYILKGYSIDCAKRKCAVETVYKKANGTSIPVNTLRVWISIDYKAMSGFVPVPKTIWGDITMATDQQR